MLEADINAISFPLLDGPVLLKALQSNIKVLGFELLLPVIRNYCCKKKLLCSISFGLVINKAAT